MNSLADSDEFLHWGCGLCKEVCADNDGRRVGDPCMFGSRTWARRVSLELPGKGVDGSVDKSVKRRNKGDAQDEGRARQGGTEALPKR